MQERRVLMGSDGHTASLCPGRAALDETARRVPGIAEVGFEPFVPRGTLTFPVLASTRDMLFVVSGTRKRNVPKRALCGSGLPAAGVYSQGDLVWLADRDAAAEPGHVA